MSKYYKPILAVLVYGASQLVCGLLLWLEQYVSNGVKISDANATTPTTLALCLLASGVLAALIVWKPMGMIRLPATFSTMGCTAKHATVGLVTGLLGVVALNLMGELTDLPDNMAETLRTVATTPLGILAVCVVGPVCEELVFREGIQGYLHRNGTHPAMAIVVASLLFGILHFNPVQTFFASLMGIVLGTLYYRTGSILLCGLLHVLNNSLAVAQMMILGDEADDFSLFDVFGGQINGIAVMVICGLVCIALLHWFCLSDTDATDRSHHFLR